MFILGYKHGYTNKELEKVMTKSLEPTGMILLVTASGGVLRYMLQYSGLGDVIGNAVSSAALPMVVVALSLIHIWYIRRAATELTLIFLVYLTLTQFWKNWVNQVP